MRVCLDTSAFRTPFSGIAYYTWFLSAELQKHRDLELLGFDGNTFSPIRGDDLQSIRKSRGADPQAASPWRSIRTLSFAARRITLLRSAYRTYKRVRFRGGMRHLDLFHATNFVPPADGISCPILPLVHDLSFERFPDLHPAERVAWLRKKLKRIHDYPIINTLSNFSAGEIADFYGVPMERLRVTWPGINPIFRSPPAESALTEVEAHGLRPRGFFLSVGTIEPRKNHSVLIDAYARLNASFRRAYPLVCVGPPGWGKINSRSVDVLRSEGTLQFTGYVSEEVLSALYARACALLFPSLYEGFGIPVAEALATGLPVVVSDIPVMHELAGEAGHYMSPQQPDDWAEAIRYYAELSASSRLEIAAAAQSRSELFSWRETARRTAEIYYELQ